MLVCLVPLRGYVGSPIQSFVRLDCDDGWVAIEAAVLHVWHSAHVENEQCLLVLVLVQVQLHPIDCKALTYWLLHIAEMDLAGSLVPPTDYKAWRHWKPSVGAAEPAACSLQWGELAHIEGARYREAHAPVVDETELVVRKLDHMAVAVVELGPGAVDSDHVTYSYRAVEVDLVAVEDEPQLVVVYIVSDVGVEQVAEVVALLDSPARRNWGPPWVWYI